MCCISLVKRELMPLKGCILSPTDAHDSVFAEHLFEHRGRYLAFFVLSWKRFRMELTV